VIFGEISSPYFDANPGSREKLPGIAKIFPVTTPEACADVIVRTIARPKREVIAPFMVRLLAWAYWLFPGPVHWFIRVTRRQRPGR